MSYFSKFLVYLALLISTHSVFSNNCTEIMIDLSRLTDLRGSSTETLKEHAYSLGEVAPFETYKEDLVKINAGLRAKNTDPAKYESIFYPLMGTDIALPLVIFPNTKTIVTLDHTPFLKNNQATDQSIITIQAPLGGPWRRGHHIEMEGNVAPRLIGALLSAFPNAKILSLKGIISPPQNTKTDRFSAVLKFDLQDGKGERKLVYFNESVPRSDDQDIKDVLDLVWDYRPNVSIFKGSMGIAKGTFGQNVLNKMRAEHGLILEGTAIEVLVATGVAKGYEPEFSKPFQVDKLPNLHSSGQSYIIPEIKFGYNIGVLVTDFK